MALIITDEIIRSFSGQPNSKSSNAYILVKKNSLAEPYNLLNKTRIEGVILEVKDATGRKIPELISKKISFILEKGARYSSHDLLFILEDTWKDLRDYGIILNNSFLSIRIEKANEVMIYPKRDVSG